MDQMVAVHHSTAAGRFPCAATGRPVRISQTLNVLGLLLLLVLVDHAGDDIKYRPRRLSFNQSASVGLAIDFASSFAAKEMSGRSSPR